MEDLTMSPLGYSEEISAVTKQMGQNSSSSAGKVEGSRKAYLGDSVYVDIDDFGNLILTTENGLPGDPSNSILLEPAVLTRLKEYIDRNYSGST